ncbi:hypothetical protein E2562_028716 [Oryza meyeriana var. granulata]|uniref:Uncharacterized protein n=1 Tax=Oryza meyeriana var. granulata TaxID=110450 RepID=A0A6G1D943_9ORYZ|nr:hypothetical protein E2562_028716 [Oryza meyeriana var. granulata]
MVAWAVSFLSVRRCGRNGRVARRARLAGTGIVHGSSMQDHMAARFAEKKARMEHESHCRGPLGDVLRSKGTGTRLCWLDAAGYGVDRRERGRFGTPVRARRTGRKQYSVASGGHSVVRRGGARRRLRLGWPAPEQ